MASFNIFDPSSFANIGSPLSSVFKKQEDTPVPYAPGYTPPPPQNRVLNPMETMAAISQATETPEEPVPFHQGVGPRTMVPEAEQRLNVPDFSQYRQKTQDERLNNGFEYLKKQGLTPDEALKVLQEVTKRFEIKKPVPETIEPGARSNQINPTASLVSDNLQSGIGNIENPTVKQAAQNLFDVGAGVASPFVNAVNRGIAGGNTIANAMLGRGGSVTQGLTDIGLGTAQSALNLAYPGATAGFGAAGSQQELQPGLEKISAPFNAIGSAAVSALPESYKKELRPEQVEELKGTAGLVIPIGVVKAIPKAAEIAKKTGAKTVDKLDTTAQNFLYEAVNPTTKENKAVLKERVNDLLPYIEKNPFKNSLEKVKERVDVDNTKALESMKNYEDNVGVKGTLLTDPVALKLQEKYQQKVGESYIDPQGAKIAQEYIDILRGFGKEVKDANIIKIRRAWDKIEERNKGFMKTADSTVTGDIVGDANKFFREEIRKSNPEYAEKLSDFSKTRTLSDILDATITRRTGQQKGGFIRRGLENMGRITGATVGGIPGYIAAEALIQGGEALSSSAAKLTTGKLLSKKGEHGIRSNVVDSTSNNISNKQGGLNSLTPKQLTKTIAKKTYEAGVGSTTSSNLRRKKAKKVSPKK